MGHVVAHVAVTGEPPLLAWLDDSEAAPVGQMMTTSFADLKLGDTTCPDVEAMLRYAAVALAGELAVWLREHAASGWPLDASAYVRHVVDGDHDADSDDGKLKKLVSMPEIDPAPFISAAIDMAADAVHDRGLVTAIADVLLARRRLDAVELWDLIDSYRALASDSPSYLVA